MSNKQCFKKSQKIINILPFTLRLIEKLRFWFPPLISLRYWNVFVIGPTKLIWHGFPTADCEQFL